MDQLQSPPYAIASAVAALESASQPWIAFEYSPPKTASGVANLQDRMARMKRHAPLYIDVTWGAGGSSSDTTLGLCIEAQKLGLVANMHLTCTNMPREKLDNALVQAQAHSLVNLLALRGDPPVGQVDFQPVETGFSCALDLISYLNATHPNVFSITCAGYPEGHPNRIHPVTTRELTPTELARAYTDYETNTVLVCSDADFAAELAYLKAKVQAGARMIVTQMFYDVQVYVDFVDACRREGITVPIVPGIMCITTAPGFFKMVKFCKTRVPKSLHDEMTALSNAEPEVLKEFAIKYGLEMCQAILQSKRSSGLHFYTLNLDAVVDGILAGLDWNPQAARAGLAQVLTQETSKGGALWWQASDDKTWWA